jgi:hypothetical protein
MQAEDNTFIDAGDTSGQERSLLQAKINATRSLQEIAVEKLSSRFCFNYAGSTGGPPNVPMTLNYPSMNGNPVAYTPTSPDMIRSPYISTNLPSTSNNTNIYKGERIAGSFISDPPPGFKAYGSGSGGGQDMIFDGTSSILPVWYGSSIGSPSVRSIDLIWGFNYATQPFGQNWARITWGIRVIRPNGANVPVIICFQDSTIGQTTMQLPSGTGDIFGDATLVIQVLNKVADSTVVPFNSAFGQPNELNVIRVTANILGACTPQPAGFPAIPIGVTTFPYAYSIGHTPTLFCNLNLS